MNADGTPRLSAFDPDSADDVPDNYGSSAGRWEIPVGGAFSNLQPNGSPVPSRGEGIARFNADGSLDPAFDPSAFTSEPWLCRRTGRSSSGGTFTALRPNGACSPRGTASPGSSTTRFQIRVFRNGRVRARAPGKIAAGHVRAEHQRRSELGPRAQRRRPEVGATRGAPAHRSQPTKRHSCARGWPQ